MKRIAGVALVLTILLPTVVACRGQASVSRNAEPTPDTQATVNAAVAGTATAQAGIQATIDAGVQGTATAQAAVATATRVVVQSPTTPAIAQASPAAVTPAPLPTINPTPAPPNYYALTEAELAALIDEAVAEAVNATTAATTASTTSTSDGTVTVDEAQMMEMYAMAAEAAIAYSEELINSYFEIYGDVAMETMALLEEVEDDLSSMSESMELILSVLETNSETLAQGLALAEETISQIETATQTALAVANQVNGRSDNWQARLGDELNRLAAQVQAIQPNAVAGDLPGALALGFNFLDSTQQALGDNKITRDELMNLAQIGANAGASLSQYGGPAMQQMPDRFKGVTTHIARGELPQARDGVTSLERDLGPRPQLPQPGNGGDRPDVDRPDVGQDHDRPGKK